MKVLPPSLSLGGSSTAWIHYPYPLSLMNPGNFSERKRREGKWRETVFSKMQESSKGKRWRINAIWAANLFKSGTSAPHIIHRRESGGNSELWITRWRLHVASRLPYYRPVLGGDYSSLSPSFPLNTAGTWTPNTPFNLASQLSDGVNAEIKMTM